MGKIYAAIDPALSAFLLRQRVFFVATAPLGGDGFINLSPKGLNTFAILDPQTVAYLDLTGSGVETVANVRENGRVTVLFCAFDGAPKIVRLQGRGTAFEPGEPDFDTLSAAFEPREATRSIVRVALERISDSCGYGVPLYRYEGERPQLAEWAARKGADGIRTYQAEHNRVSVNGLPGLRIKS